MDGVGGQVQSAPGSYFTPLLISMAGIVSTVLAVIVYHFMVMHVCLRHRQRQSQRILEAVSNFSTQQNPNSGPAGIDEKVLGSIPILCYSSKNDELFGLDQSECVICLGELEDGDMVRLLPNCKHLFHNPCIETWFSGHTNCPVCRAPTAVQITTSHEDQENQDQQVRDVASRIACSNSFSTRDERGLLVRHINATTLQLPNPNRLLRHCVSLVLLPAEDRNKQQALVNGLERSLSLDTSHVLINIQRECDDDHKPSSSTSTSSSSSSSSSSSTKAVLVECGSFRERSIRQLDRMSTVLIRSIGQLRMGQSSSMANSHHGILPC